MEINKLIEGVYVLKNGTILEVIDIGVYGGVIQIYSNEENYIDDIRCTDKDFLNLSANNTDSVCEKFISFIMDNEDKYNICEEELEEMNFYRINITIPNKMAILFPEVRNLMIF
ncbi:hypothetical protein CVJ63_23010 (plasmid) [Salmonella enterica subsp. enterica serovar Hadar]|uniref:hypothetical protein n=1 Tax=Salmonella enterica TaxID=28901 RepID=UPI001083BFD1|nr:hypothetical protein [Salmonella enterica]QBY79518.1 hypothetical protein CVJ63_23010 [Salmonella enterica subsp. enterica serovar Hadar]